MKPEVGAKKTVDPLLRIYQEAYGQVPDWAEGVSQTMPGLLGPWMEIRSKVIADRVLPRKVKELILLGINLVRRCPPGIETHMRGALEAGATPEEIMEAIDTAVLSGAAPAMYNGPRALKEELRKRKDPAKQEGGRKAGNPLWRGRRSPPGKEGVFPLGPDCRPAGAAAKPGEFGWGRIRGTGGGVGSLASGNEPEADP